MLPVTGKLSLSSQRRTVRTLRFRYNATSFQDSRPVSRRDYFELGSRVQSLSYNSVFLRISTCRFRRGKRRVSGDISGHDRKWLLISLLNQGDGRKIETTPKRVLDGNGGDRTMKEISNEKYYSRIIARNRGAGALASAPPLRRPAPPAGKKVGLAPSKLALKPAKSGVQRTGRKWRLQQLIDCWLVAYHLHRRRQPFGTKLRAMA